MTDGLTRTRDGAVVLVEVDAHASALPSADATAPASTQRNGHHAIHIGQHDGNADTCKHIEFSAFNDCNQDAFGPPLLF